jgi:hypothetical protein
MSALATVGGMVLLAILFGIAILSHLDTPTGSDEVHPQ